MKVYSEKAFEIEGHLDRLERSAAALGIDLPARVDLINWVEKIAAELGEGAVRIVVTRGASIPGLDDPSRVIVFGHPWGTVLGPGRLLPVEAPWHSAGTPWDLAGAKVTSYAPHMSASRRARAEGFEDALLVTTAGVMLEGPTFSVAWVVDGTLETPTVELGILDSITRRVVLGDARADGVQVVEGIWSLDRLGRASEVMAYSTIREVQPVIQVGEAAWEPGPLTARLTRMFEDHTG